MVAANSAGVAQTGNSTTVVMHFEWNQIFTAFAWSYLQIIVLVSMFGNVALLLATKTIVQRSAGSFNTAKLVLMMRHLAFGGLFTGLTAPFSFYNVLLPTRSYTSFVYTCTMSCWLRVTSSDLFTALQVRSWYLHRCLSTTLLSLFKINLMPILSFRDKLSKAGRHRSSREGGGKNFTTTQLMFQITLSIERCLALCQPFWSRKHVTKQRLHIILLACWVGVLLKSLIAIRMAYSALTTATAGSKVQICLMSLYLDTELRQRAPVFVMPILLTIILLALNMLVIRVANNRHMRMGTVALRANHERNFARKQSNLKLTTTMSGIFIGTALIYVPKYITFFSFSSIGRTYDKHAMLHVEMAALMMVPLSAVTSAIVFTITTPEVKAVYTTLYVRGVRMLGSMINRNQAITTTETNKAIVVTERCISAAHSQEQMRESSCMSKF